MWVEKCMYLQALCLVLQNSQVSPTENQSVAVWPPEINLAFLTYSYDPNIYVLVAKMAVQRLKNDSVVPKNVKFKFVIFHLISAISNNIKSKMYILLNIENRSPIQRQCQKRLLLYSID